MNSSPTPDLVDLRIKAAALHQAGDCPQALVLYQEILTLQPLADDILVNAAEILSQLGSYDQAIDALQKAVQINPRNALGWYNLGFLLQHRSDWPAAERATLRATELAPEMHMAWFVLGNICRQTGRYPQAVENYKTSLRLRENHAEAWCNLGLVFAEQDLTAEAATAYLNALRHDFTLVSAHANLGILLLQVGQLDGAKQACERALSFDPNNANTMNTLGAIYGQRGEHELALQQFRAALAAQPDFWKTHSNMLFCVLHKDGTTLAEVLELHQEWYRTHGEKQARHGVRFQNLPEPDRRLRVGFVSGDFRAHPVGYFIFNTLSRLLVEKPFDIFLYANQYEENDEFAIRFRNLAGENWRPIWGLTTDRALAQIGEDKIDVLFDLTGHNNRNRLDIFCARGAPVQVTWAGYMATTGVEQMDWILCDNVQTPLADQPFYTERIYPLPNSFICYTPSPDAPGLAGTPPSIANGYISFASFNKPTKVTARTVRLWSTVMRELPGSRLLMKFSGLSDPGTVKFFHDRFAAHGIPPDRIILENSAPHHELLARYNTADIALDTVPYTGSTTTLEALLMATPLVTLPGEIFPARHAASYLTAIGAPELIAKDEDDYVQKIITLARDPDRLHHYKKTLRDQMLASPMCNQDLFVPEFVRAIRHMWQDWCLRQK